MHTSDPDWPAVRALQQGEDAALDRLIQRHRDPLLAFLTRMTGHRQDAEELAQETFVRAYFQIRQFRPRAPFAAWLYQIARNLCRDYFRSRAFKQRLLSESLDDPAIGRARRPENDNTLSRDRIETVQRALLKVPAKLRECLILTTIEGLTHAEAAERLGISAKAVETRAARARAMLAKILKNF